MQRWFDCSKHTYRTVTPRTWDLFEKKQATEREETPPLLYYIFRTSPPTNPLPTLRNSVYILSLYDSF